MWKRKRIYVDYASATPLSREARKAMDDIASSSFANPSAIHYEGVAARNIVEESRKRIALTLGVQSSTLVFTGSGTEANNLALRIADSNKKLRKGKILMSRAVHPSLTEAARGLVDFGVDTREIDVDEYGRMDLEILEKSIDKDTLVVSFVLGNSEIGTLERVREISRIVKERSAALSCENIFVHIDASACPSTLDVSPQRLGAHLMTLDASKIYGPKGVGILYVSPEVKLVPLIMGGGQEKGLRSGTETVENIAGASVAFTLAHKNKKEESKRLRSITDKFVAELKRHFPDAIQNGHPDDRLDNVINFCFPGINAEYAVLAMDAEGVAISYASSCVTLGSQSYSKVISVLPGHEQCVGSSLRFSFGKGNNMSDVIKIVNALKVCIPKAKMVS